MKVGDQLSVQLEGHTVGVATIEDISDGKATILIPATRVVMGVRQSLVADVAPETDRVFAGTAETSEPNTSDASEEAESAAVEEGVSLSQQNLDSSALDKE